MTRTVTDADQALIAAMLEPRPLEEARSSLEFWRRRRASLPLYRRSARREADIMIRRCQERVLAAERRRYGIGFAGLVRRLLAWDLTPPAVSGRGVAALVWRLLPRPVRVLAGAVVTAWILVAALTLVALAHLLG